MKTRKTYGGGTIETTVSRSVRTGLFSLRLKLPRGTNPEEIEMLMDEDQIISFACGILTGVFENNLAKAISESSVKGKYDA